MRVNIYSFFGDYVGGYTGKYPLRNWMETNEHDIMWYQFPRHIDDGLICWAWNDWEGGMDGMLLPAILEEIKKAYIKKLMGVCENLINCENIPHNEG